MVSIARQAQVVLFRVGLYCSVTLVGDWRKNGLKMVRRDNAAVEDRIMTLQFGWAICVSGRARSLTRSTARRAGQGRSTPDPARRSARRSRRRWALGRR